MPKFNISKIQNVFEWHRFLLPLDEKYGYENFSDSAWPLYKRVGGFTFRKIIIGRITVVSLFIEKGYLRYRNELKNTISKHCNVVTLINRSPFIIIWTNSSIWINDINIFKKIQFCDKNDYKKLIKSLENTYGKKRKRRDSTNGKKSCGGEDRKDS
jgi:hypothetical protein